VSRATSNFIAARSIPTCFKASCLVKQRPRLCPAIKRNPRIKYPKSIMSLIEEKNLKVIIFSSKQEDWKFWEVKLLTRARCMGFREILLGTVKIPMDLETFDLSKPAEKAQHLICRKNKLAFEELVLSIDTSKGDGRVTFQLVCCCKTNDCKNGNAVDAWKHLTAKYALNMVPIKLELKSEFQKSKL